MRLLLKYVLYLALLSSCVEQIELEMDSRGDQIVIFGGINTVAIGEQLEIYQTSTVQNRNFPIVGATVTVRDNFGSQTRMFGDANGVYKFGSNRVTFIPGREYYVDIILLNGEHYQSHPQMLPTARAFEIVSREFKQKESVSGGGALVTTPILEITGTTRVENLNDDDFFFRWQVQETYVLRPTDFPDPFNSVPLPYYFTNFVSPQRITLFDGNSVRPDTLGAKILGERLVDYSFRDRHYFTIISHSISEEALNFWNQVDIVTNASGSIFDLPPARIEGNIFNVNDPDEIVLGFFEVANSTLTRFFTVVSDSPFLVPETGCEFDENDPSKIYPDYCLECLPEDGCSFNRPDFFPG